jgi:hypothetical protein
MAMVISETSRAEETAEHTGLHSIPIFHAKTRRGDRGGANRVSRKDAKTQRRQTGVGQTGLTQRRQDAKKTDRGDHLTCNARTAGCRLDAVPLGLDTAKLWFFMRLGGWLAEVGVLLRNDVSRPSKPEPGSME